MARVEGQLCKGVVRIEVPILCVRCHFGLVGFMSSDRLLPELLSREDFGAASLSAREAVQRVRPTAPASGRPITCPCSRALATPALILFIIAPEPASGAEVSSIRRGSGRSD